MSATSLKAHYKQAPSTAASHAPGTSTKRADPRIPTQRSPRPYRSQRFPMSNTAGPDTVRCTNGAQAFIMYAVFGDRFGWGEIVQDITRSNHGH